MMMRKGQRCSSMRQMMMVAPSNKMLTPSREGKVVADCRILRHVRPTSLALNRVDHRSGDVLT